MMSVKSISLVLAGVAVFGLAACSSTYNPDKNLKNAEYWQRVDTASATYMRGPKAHQILHRDIARCVTELREMQRLGLLRKHIPGETTISGVPVTSTPEGALTQWNTPDRDGYLYSEHSDYQEFETCMMAKGWERVKHIPYDVSKKSREDYLDALKSQGYKVVTKDDVDAGVKPDWQKVNN